MILRYDYGHDDDYRICSSKCFSYFSLSVSVSEVSVGFEGSLLILVYFRTPFIPAQWSRGMILA
jgi:hypothetical protein